MPVDEAGCLSFIYFAWLDKLIWKSFRFGLAAHDVSALVFPSSVDCIECFRCTRLLRWISTSQWFISELSGMNELFKCGFSLSSAATNGARIANLWEEECRAKGLHNASLTRTFLNFVRARTVITVAMYLMVLLFGYISAV